jgi:adenine-specific DNA-methyltransferase
MGDLLKNLRSSQIFSVCGLPDTEITKAKKADTYGPQRYTIRLFRLHPSAPITNDLASLEGPDVPCWM